MLKNINKLQIQSILDWYGLMGVDDNIEEAPRNRINQVKPQEAKPTIDVVPANNVLEDKPRTVIKKRVVLSQMPDISKIDNIADMVAVLKDFDGHPLKRLATNTVVCDGDINTDLMVIGEAPGDNEDKEGLPFVGASGQLMRRMMKYAKNDSYFITNVVFWRPPANRVPSPEEVDICYPFLAKMIEIIKPKIIITMGLTASTTILKDIAKEKTMANLRGVLYNVNANFGDIKVMATYHPACLLRAPKKKKETWSDFLEVRRILDNK